ncbi:MAG: carboxypeptidase regulatory-like domain-containing protein [Methylococcales bacterium]
MNKFSCLPTQLKWRFVITMALLFAAITPPHADTGNDWLVAQFQADGSIATDAGIATAYQSSAETLQLWKETGDNKAITPTALQYLENENYGGTEYLARLILARNDSGLNVVNQIDVLKSRANADGGFGELEGYGSNVPDTAFALQTLNRSGYGNIPAANSSVKFLLNAQKSDGGWAIAANDNNIYVTALAAIALSPYKSSVSGVPAALNAAHNFLLSKRDGNGLWGEDHTSAVALIALLSDGAEASLFQSSAAALTNKQAANGSWSDDVYTTALALRALAAYTAANSGVSGSQTGTVTGYIVKENSHEPLANVEISLASVTGFTVLSDSTGYFKMTGVPVNTQTLVARKNGYNSLSRVVTVVSSQISDAGTLGLSADPQTGAVRGHIEDSQDHSVLSGALITLTGSDSHATVSDSGGNFEWSSLLPGDYSVQIDKAGYYSVNGMVTVAGGGSVILKQSLIKIGVFLDNAPYNLFGKIIDGESGEALSGAQIAMSGGATVATGNDGSFVFNAMPRGGYQANLSADGYQNQSISFTFSPGSNGDLGLVRLYRLGGSVMPSSLTVSGRVVDGLSGAAINNAVVKWVETGENIQTATDGTFAIAGIDSLNFSLTFTAPSFSERTFTLNASGFGEIFQEFSLSPISSNPAAINSLLNGVVKNSLTGLPVAGAKVSLNDGRDLSAISSNDGKFEFAGITNLNFALNASAEGYFSTIREVTLSAHGSYTTEIAVEPLAQADVQSFQIVSLNPPNKAAGANETLLFTAEIANLLTEAQDAVILGEIVNSEGISIATVSPYAPGTTELGSKFSFAPKESNTFTVPWNTAQTAPGTYRLILRTIKPGTINQSLPFGQVLAENQTYGQIVSTTAFDGALSLNPPLTQAGSQSPVKLDVYLSNTGNTDLKNVPLTLTIEQPGTGNVLHQVTATLDKLAVNDYQNVSFGNWIPAAEGNLPIKVRATDSVVSGDITGALYVGDKAAGKFSVDKTFVPEGTQTAHGKITLEGVDTASGKATDPLFFAVGTAVKTGSAYAANGAMFWQKSNRCGGCHIQTQSLVGVASAFQKNLGDEASAINLYNTIASTQQNDGGLRSSYPQYTKTQTALGAWSLTAWNAEESFRTLYRASQHLYGKRTQSGNQTWWTPDHASGWWYSNDAQTALTVKAYSHLLKTAQTTDLNRINDYRLDSKVLLGSGTSPRDVELAKDGLLYTVKGSGEITRINIETNTVEPVAKLAIDGYGIAVADDGVIYVSGNGGKLLRRNLDGTVDTLLTGAGILTDVEISTDGRVYVVDYTNKKILWLNDSGQWETWVAGGVLNSPYGLTFDEAGNAYVANFGGFNIVKIDPAKNVSIFADGLAYQPLYIDHKPGGGFYYSSYEYSNLGQYTPFGINALSANGVVERLTSMAGVMMGVAVDGNGQTYVVNSAENKLYQLTAFVLNTAQLTDLATEITRAGNFFLARYKDGSTDNIIQAIRLTGLAEARKVISDTALTIQIDTAITFISNTLRTRQRADGGWGKTTDNVSDAMVTALVGLAIDYTNPSADDPIVRKTIQYLLSAQQADHSWLSSNSILTTRLASTSLVVAYLPIALERLGGIDVDLHVNFPASIQLTNPVPAPASQTFNANGGIDYFWKLEGVTANQRSLDFDLALKNMALKEQRSVADAAYIEFNNSFTTEKLRVDLEIPKVKAASGLALSLTTDRISYTANEPVLIRPVVSNTGPKDAGGTAEVNIRAAGSHENLATLNTLSVPTMASGANPALETQWNSGTVLAGNYEAYVRLLDTQGRVVDEATAPFQIVAGVSALVDGHVVTDKPIYAAWDSVNISARIENITANALQPPTLVEMTVTTPDGSLILNESATLGELVPNALRDLQFPLNLVDALNGDYAVMMTVKDAVSHATIITRASVFHVDHQPFQALSGKVDVTPVQVTQGDPASCLETVLNKAASPITSVVLTSQVVSAQTQQVLSSQTRNADLAANGQRVETRNIATGTLPIGTYACLLLADIGGQTRQLGAALFNVLEPPIRINADLKAGKHGRLLVLIDPLDEQCQKEKEDHDDSSDTEQQDDNADDDHHKDCQSQQAERDYLDTLLQTGDWAYTRVDTAKDYVRALHSGSYTLHALLSSHVTLDEAVQNELREAVNRGEGLLEAGNNHHRQAHIDKTLGLKYLGTSPRMSGISINTGGFTPAGQLPLQSSDANLRFTLDGATTLGNYLKNGQLTSMPALTERSVGLGRSLHVGYDLLAEAALPWADPRHGQLLLDALNRINPAPLLPFAHTAYPLTISLTNAGMATPGRVVLNLPATVNVIESGGADINDGKRLVWDFDLANNASAEYTAWVALPEQPVTFSASVESGRGTDYKTQRELSLTVETLNNNDLQAALATSAPLTSKPYKPVHNALQQAYDQCSIGHWQDCLKALLQTADALIALNTPTAASIRLSVDQALRSTAIHIGAPVNEKDLKNELNKESDQ